MSSESQKPYCYHDTVRRQIEYHGDRTDKWKCACGEDFFCSESFVLPGDIIQFVPAALTLRDQCAIAALQGYLRTERAAYWQTTDETKDVADNAYL